MMYQEVMTRTRLSEEDLDRMMATSLDRADDDFNLTTSKFPSAAGKWGNGIQGALDSVGITTIATLDDIHNMTKEEQQELVRSGKIYPGMVFVTKNGYHTGYIESINADLTWNTIEGNTFIRYADGSSESNTVGSHTNDASVHEDLLSMTDSTTKVMYWLLMSEFTDLETINENYGY